MSTATPAIAFKAVQKSYGPQAAVLRGISLDVQPGEFFGLVGVNGAGKSTLLKCLLDFCAFDAGSIDVFGVDSRQTRARAVLSFLPERFMPPYYLTGRDFLKYAMALHQQPYDEARALITLQALDLDVAALGRSARTYSKGMMQKLGLVACFLADRALYVLDEPMSGLDPQARALLKSRLRQLKSTGGTLFFSSHSLSDVEEMCDRLVILHEGTLRFVGSAQACRDQFQADTLEEAYLTCIARHV